MTPSKRTSPSKGLYLIQVNISTEKHIHVSMPRVGFEPTTPVLERAMTVHALDSGATVTGPCETNGTQKPTVSMHVTSNKTGDFLFNSIIALQDHTSHFTFMAPWLNEYMSIQNLGLKVPHS
jgi:hypothetical protein